MSDERVINGLAGLTAAQRDGVLTIGNFDGVHLGHQRILATARSLADREGLPVVAMTFEPPPDAVMKHEPLPHRITPSAARSQLLLRHGADYVVTLRTDSGLLSMQGREFIMELVVAHLAPREMVEGHDFTFGRGRQGSVEMLAQLGREGGFEVHVVEPVSIELDDGERRVSSTLIRQLVSNGDMVQAARCLGRPFALYGNVIPGQGRGRVLEFPTVNIDPREQVSPPDGVYAGLALLGERQYVAAVSIGHKLTLGPTLDRYVEAFLLDASGDFYSLPLELRLLERLREQRKFADADELRGQIARDVATVRERVKL